LSLDKVAIVKIFGKNTSL